MEEYFSYDSRKDIESFSKVPTETWMKLGEQKALETFQTAAKAVPAYRDFLKKNKVNPEKIKTYEDFKKVPLTTKDNYFRNYQLEKLVMGGDLSKATVIHSSSGSTGKPLYWPKLPIQDVNTYKGVELLYVNYFNIDKVKTLLINCFSMGPWPAGEIVHTASKMMGDKGLNISVISPGLQSDLFFGFLNDLSEKFEQTIIAGYPSYLKTLIEEGIERGINFKKYNIRMLTGGEKFSENWRNFMCRATGNKQAHTFVASVLGSSETGVTSISTPFTDLIRIYLGKNSKLSETIFDRKDIPSITQFLPPAKQVEIINNQIVVSSLGLLPLVRYDTKDLGKILTPEEFVSLLPKKFNDFYKSNNVMRSNLPILTISGRSDGTLSFYALNIYPEQITQIIESAEVKKYITGKTIIQSTESKKSEPTLELELELKTGTRAHQNLKNNLQEILTNKLADINSEYAHLLKTVGKKAKLNISLKDNGWYEKNSKSGKSILIRN